VADHPAGGEACALGRRNPTAYFRHSIRMPGDVSTASIYHDEFGSLSSNSEWVPKEMFKRAMHDLHPEVANIESRYVFNEGYYIPKGPALTIC
jgi:hypothetical protein